MAGDTVPVGAADAAVSLATPAPPTRAPSARAAKLAAFNAAVSAETTAPAVEAAPVPSQPAQETASAPPPVDPALAAAPVSDEAEPKPDPVTAKGLDAIEKRDRRAREQLAADRAAAKAELELERAELARLRAEVTGKATSIDELRALAKSKPLEALKRLGIESEDDYEVIARQTYAVSKSGKADPKNKAYADQTAKERELSDAIADLKRQQAELANEFKTRDTRAQVEQFQSRYLDEAVNAIPAAEPTFIALAHAAQPAKARAALLAIGQRIEAATGETPSHAEVIAQYESDKRAQLAESGLTDEQIASLLRKPAPAAPKTPVPRTLDPGARPTTPALNGSQTRIDKIRAAEAAIRKLESTTT